VLGVLQACPDIAGVTVITPSSEVARLARGRDIDVSMDPGSGWKLGALVDAALRDEFRRGAGTVVVMMSDLPNLELGDVNGILDGLRAVDVVVAPDRHDQGTNALALCARNPLVTAFGNADSCARHLAAIDAAGLRAGVYRSPGLGLDVDLPPDLELVSAWLRAGSGRKARG
jgi:2-phospho-L-lactate/phosphoenolpyruvate guanylyltransferase